LPLFFHVTVRGPAPTIAAVALPFPALEVSPNMKWTRNRFLPLTYVGLLVAFAVIGCTSKQDPAEVLTTCGNASCGDLTMVTSDTASDGYHYLNPSVSPDGSRILFTADWWALPAEPKDPGDVYYVNYRQMLILPFPPLPRLPVEPESDLAGQGAELIKLQEVSVMIGGEPNLLLDVLNDDKGDPIWEDNEKVIFFLRIGRVGNRLFRADLADDSALPGLTKIAPIFMEPTDATTTPRQWQHMQPNLSHDGRWLIFMRSGCSIPDSLETCTNLAIWALDMSTAGADGGYGTTAFPLTHEYSRIERPRFSPDGSRIVFSGGLDVDGGNGSGTEIYTMAFDTTGLARGEMVLDRDLDRVTHTSYAEGDPLTGVINSDPCYSLDDYGRFIYFVSTRRAPTTTLHDRNIWRVPADGSREPEIYFFSRYDDLDPVMLKDGTMLMSSMVGFPEADLDRLEGEAYLRIKQLNEAEHREDPTIPLLNETQLAQRASDERDLLGYFSGVMAHLYLFHGN
jgi:Tol biopolymer transport system component